MMISAVGTNGPTTGPSGLLFRCTRRHPPKSPLRYSGQFAGSRLGGRGNRQRLLAAACDDQMTLRESSSVGSDKSDRVLMAKACSFFAFCGSWSGAEMIK